MVFVWDEARSSRLMKLYGDGLSFTLIAAEMGCTRNAAIGRAHRLRLNPREPTTVLARKIPDRSKTPSNFSVANITKVLTVRHTPTPPPLPNAEHQCSINDLNDSSCRFPMWPSDVPHVFDDRFYCGVPEAELSAGRPYCRYHTRICTPDRQ